MTNIDQNNPGNLLHQHARQFFQKGQTEAARQLWTAALAENPGHVDCLAGLAELEAAAGNHAASKALWTKAVAAEPTNPSFALGLAKAVNAGLRDAGASPSASPTRVPVPSASVFETYADAPAPAPIKTQPVESPKVATPTAESSKASTPRAWEASTSAAQASTPVAQEEDDDITKAEDAFKCGKDLLKDGQVGDAIRAFKTAIKLDGSTAKYHYQLAAVYHQRQQDHESALPLYRKAIDFDPQNPVFHNALGVCLEDVGDLRGANTAIKNALAINPKDMYRQNADRVQNKLDAAQARETAAEGNRTSSTSRNAGTQRSESNTGRSTRSPSSDASDPLAPRDNDTLRQAERRRNLTTGFNTEAAVLDAQVQAKPNDPGVLLQSAYFNYAFGKWDKARSLMARVRELSPPSAETVRATVDFLKEKNDAADNFAHAVKMSRHIHVEDALPYFMAASECEPNNALYQSIHGLALLAMGMPDEMLSKVATSLDQASNDNDRRADAFVMSVACEQIGDFENARNYRQQSGVSSDASPTGADLLAACLGDNRLDIPTRGGIPSDGLIKGQKLEELEKVVAEAKTARTPRQEPPRYQQQQQAPGYNQQQQQAPGYQQQQAPRPNTQQAPRSAPQQSQSSGPQRFPGHRMPARLAAGPAVHVSQMGPVSTGANCTIKKYMDGSPLQQDLRAYGLSSQHINAIIDWMQAEYDVKGALFSSPHVLKQLLPAAVLGGVIGWAGYKTYRVLRTRERIDSMVDALNGEYGPRGVTFAYRRRPVNGWAPQFGKLTINLKGNGGY